ncbi:MAG: VOC family protein [Thermodesulfobacteriota bacterium]
MEIKHIGMASSSEENGDLFYRDLLGLKKIGSRKVSADLAKKIFGIDSPLLIINYGDENTQFELFISPQHPENVSARVDHICIQVPDRNRFFEKCRRLNLEILEIRKADGSSIYFIKDFDGNRFEIK